MKKLKSTNPIRDLRKAAGLTQVEAAERASMTQSCWSAVERRPTIEATEVGVIRRIAPARFSSMSRLNRSKYCFQLTERETMSKKHTPGPWKADHRHVDAGPNDDEMNGLGWDVIGPKPASDRGMFALAADAHLIAAAPELLEACKMALRSHDSDVENGLVSAEDAADFDWVPVARVAIAKAEQA